MSALSMVGVAVIILGAFLFIGNVTHVFPTFPLAGWLTMAVGGAILRSGKQ